MKIPYASVALAVSMFWLSSATVLTADVSSASDDTSRVADSANAAKPVDSEGPLSRWLTLDSMSFSMRYRNSDSAAGGRNFDGAQQRSLVAGKIKLDKDAKFQIGFRASSGRYFNWAYAGVTGPNFPSNRPGVIINSPTFFGFLFSLPRDNFSGPESQGSEFYMRELYLSATPIKNVIVEFGGLGIQHGAATEITTFDDDGFMVGERIRFRDKAHLYFDEVSATFGYIGDVDTPNFFARGYRLAEDNYRQVLAEKKFGSRVSASVGYDWIHGISTTREAAAVKLPESRVLDATRVELYQRVTDTQFLPRVIFPAANGWALAGEKKFGRKKWQVEGGYADIDRYNGVYTNSPVATAFGFSLNGDSYQIGKRVFARASYTPASEISVFTFFTHEVDTPTDALYNAFNHQTWQAGATINFKSILQRYGLL